MLTEPEQLLISAAVDGGLTHAEAKAFDRLLATNPAAGRLFGQLSANAARLAALPKHPAPKAVAAGVMARVRPAGPHKKPVRRPSWVPVAIAASLFLAVVAGSFLFFRGGTGQDQAQRNQLPPTNRSAVMPADVPTDDPVAVYKPGGGEDGVCKPATDDGAFAKRPEAEVPATVMAQAAPPHTPEEIQLLASALMIESKPLKQIDPTLPLLFPALDFDKDDPQARLKKELAHDSGFRLNLFSKNTAAAVEQVLAAARNAGVNVFVEGGTAERLKKPAALPYAVYLENLTADELAALFAAVAKAVNEQSRPESVLGAAHFIPADANEQKDLKELLGIDWPLAKATKPGDGRAVSEGTLKEVVTSVKKSGEKAAVAVTYAARMNAGKSSEAKQFLEKKGERKPGTVPLLIVIRPQG